MKAEIRKLLRKRLWIKDKMRYHLAKAKKFETEELPKLEAKLDELLESTKKKGGKI